MRVYLNTREAEALLRGEIQPSLITKVAAKLKPPEPLAGQQSIYDVLEGEDHGDAA
jgi:hypothetical protein